MTTGGRPAQQLVWLAITGQAIAYGLSILVARRLSGAGFEAYVVASAVFILLATLAPLGVEKLGLRQWPALLRQQDWRGARGFLRFGTRRTLVTALLVAGITAVATALAVRGATRTAILVTCLSLPAGALVHFGVDLLTAAGRPFRALAIFRIAVPATALLLFATATRLATPTGAHAIGAWGLAWVVALALMIASLRPRLDPRLWDAEARIDPGWGREARPFLVYRLAQSLLAQSGVIALGWFAAGSADVGAFAAATATTGLAAVLATATNRAYGRDLGKLLETGDRAGIAALHRRRLGWLLPPLAGFVALALLFPGALLGLFRAEFAAVGAMPLRILALTTAVTLIFALAPTQLKFERRRRELYAIVGAAAAIQVGLLVLLVPRFGATGAALAHAVAMAGSYAAFAMRARRPGA